MPNINLSTTDLVVMVVYLIRIVVWGLAILGASDTLIGGMSAVVRATPPVIAVFMCSLFWKRATATGAFVGLISGFVISISLLLGIKQTPLADWNFLYIAPMLFLVALAIIILVSLATKAPSAEVVARFVWNPSSFREEAGELEGMPWFKSFRVLSILLLIFMAVFVYIWR